MGQLDPVAGGIMRVVMRSLPLALPDAGELLLAFDYLSIDDEVIETAMDESERMLRSLDAIHLATARVLGAELAGMVTYDDRLAGAAARAGMAIVSPRD